MTPRSFPHRLEELAKTQGRRAALCLVSADGQERTVEFAELLDLSRRAATTLHHAGVAPGSRVAIALPNGLDHFCASYAAWTLGACAVPVSSRLPDAELDALLQVIGPSAVVGTRDGDVRPESLSDNVPTRASEVVSTPGKAIASGGSTGRQKLIVDSGPWVRTPGHYEEVLRRSLIRPGQTQVIGGGLFHNTPFSWAHIGLFEGHTVVVMATFETERFLELAERHRASLLPMVPTMMARLARSEAFSSADLSSVESVFHTASMCPAWVKTAWIDKVGAERVIEVYGSTEAIGSTVISGDEWLGHVGSVGRPVDCVIEIRDDSGTPLPPGVVGTIYLRRTDREEVPTTYVGSAELSRDSRGFATVGDLGSLDAEGYLYLADRRTDLIITGGENVYPAEVEAAIGAHEDVADVAVVGLPDPDWGHRVHAVVELTSGATVSAAELDDHCRRRLARYKCPKEYEFWPVLPRNEAGKLRRGEVRLIIEAR